MATAAAIIALAKKQIGYHEGRSRSGNWNNIQKYSPAVPGLEWSNGQAWCATFISWLALKTGMASLYPRTASTDAGAAWWKARGQWSEYPVVGAQGYLGHGNDMFHTFLVIEVTATHVRTIEGNTNNNGSSQGDGVYSLLRRRRDPIIRGYGHPKFSAVKKPVKKPAPKPAPKPVAHKPAPKPAPKPVDPRTQAPNLRAADLIEAASKGVSRDGVVTQMRRAAALLRKGSL